MDKVYAIQLVLEEFLMNILLPNLANDKKAPRGTPKRSATMELEKHILNVTLIMFSSMLSCESISSMAFSIMFCIRI